MKVRNRTGRPNPSRLWCRPGTSV